MTHAIPHAGMIYMDGEEFIVFPHGTPDVEMRATFDRALRAETWSSAVLYTYRYRYGAYLRARMVMQGGA
jgi:hypothetical protein